MDDNFLEIDEHALDKEWIKQPALYYKYAKKLADARLEQQEAQNDLEAEKADLDRMIREDPDEYDLPKITEAGVAATIIAQSEYKDALKAVQRKQHEVATLQAAVTAFDHKRKALEKLVDLHGQNYFSEPRAKTTTARKGIEEIKKASSRKKKLKRKGN